MGGNGEGSSFATICHFLVSFVPPLHSTPPPFQDPSSAYYPLPYCTVIVYTKLLQKDTLLSLVELLFQFEQINNKQRAREAEASLYVFGFSRLNLIAHISHLYYYRILLYYVFNYVLLQVKV